MQIKVKEQYFYFCSSFQSRNSRVFNHGNRSYPKLNVRRAVACSWVVIFISKNTTSGHLFQIGVIWCIKWYSQMWSYQQENKIRVKYKFNYSCQNETNKFSFILSIIVLQSVIFEKKKFNDKLQYFLTDGTGQNIMIYWVIKIVIYCWYPLLKIIYHFFDVNYTSLFIVNTLFIFFIFFS
jgi:hypothetical protein